MIHGANEDLRLLKGRLATIEDIHSAASVLAWDRQTYMLEGGVGGRAEQLASLASTAHEMLVSSETGRLFEVAGGREPGSDDAALLRLAWREHGRAVRLPARLVAETSRATALAEQAWIQARTRSDWSLFEPHLERVLTLKQEEAGHLDGEHPYDAMLDRYISLKYKGLSPVPFRQGSPGCRRAAPKIEYVARYAIKLARRRKTLRPATTLVGQR